MKTFSWMSLGILLAVVPLAGCGGGGDDAEGPAGPATPADLIRQLAQNASRRRVEAVLELLTDDALKQNGKAWMKYLDLTETEEIQQHLRATPAKARKEIEKAADAKAFFTALKEHAPMVLSQMFNLNVIGDEGIVEEGDRMLVLVLNGRAKEFPLAMQRQADKTLKLLGENATAKAKRDLGRQLRAKVNKAEADRLKERLEEERQMKKNSREQRSD